MEKPGRHNKNPKKKGKKKFQGAWAWETPLKKQNPCPGGSTPPGKPTQHTTPRGGPEDPPPRGMEGQPIREKGPKKGPKTRAEFQKPHGGGGKNKSPPPPGKTPGKV